MFNFIINISLTLWDSPCIRSRNLQRFIYSFFFLVAPTLVSLLSLLEYRAEFPQFLDQGQSVGLLGRVISSSQGHSACTQTQKNAHTQTLNIHALSGIRIHGPGFQASEDSARLRPLGYRDRHEQLYENIIIM
jgi:hypothetical protein